MNLHLERRQAERRQPDRGADELSPEYLALLEVCGGEIRAADRAALADRREAVQAEALAPPATSDDLKAARKKEVVVPTEVGSTDRRRAGVAGLSSDA